MSKLLEILRTGRAPGYKCNNDAVDHESVYHKGPKGLKEVENQPKWKGGPNHSSKDIANHFGMSRDFIKHTWSKAVPLLAFMLCLSAFGSGEITPGYVFTTTASADTLGKLVSQATIGPTFYSAKTAMTTPTLNDTILALQNGNLYQESVSLFFTPLIANQTALSGAANVGDQLLIYSTNSAANRSVTVSNLLNGSSIINASSLTFGNSNGFNLSNFSASLFSTNDPPYIPIYGTNGIPKQIALTNLLASASGNLGTNLLVPYHFTQIFRPYDYGWTNFYTNVWGGYTNTLAITNLYVYTNGTQFPFPTLVDTDTVPVYSFTQKTNTTATLSAVYQYMTNRTSNLGLPSYTSARVQFQGIANSLLVSNNASGTTIQVSNNASFSFTAGTIYPMLFITNTTQTQKIFLNVYTNQIVYVIPQATNTTVFQVYSNYTSALAITNPMAVNNTGSGGFNFLAFVTNYTSYNCDAIPVVNALPTSGAGPTYLPGVYDVFFRTNSTTTNYYVSGSSTLASGRPGIVFIENQNISGAGGYPPSTNRFRVGSGDQNIGTPFVANSSLMHVIVNPQ